MESFKPVGRSDKESEKASKKVPIERNTVQEVKGRRKGKGEEC